MQIRRLLSAILALVLLLGLAPAPAAAAHGIGLGLGLRFGFQDVPENDWAWPYVVEMHAKGLMKGVGDGRFLPSAPLTRAEAVTVAVRLMGLEEEAQALSESRIRELLPFSDRDQIPAWARPYIAVAVDYDIMPVAEDGLLRANEKATRLWVSVLLVRALGYEAEAQAKMTATLPFRDADLIPASLVGYVATAVDHQLVQGFPDGTFRPNDPLTRAQAAALLSRTDRQLGEQGRFRPGYLVGDLVSASERNLTITLAVKGRNRTLAVAPDAPVFLDERRADLDDLPKGARVSVVLDNDELVLMVIAHSPVSLPGVTDVKGEISAIFLPSEMPGGLGLVVLKQGGGKEKVYPLAPQVTATYDGRPIALDQLRVGDKVELDVIAGVVIAIEVTERGSGTGKENQIKGTIVAVKPYGISFLGAIDIKVGNSTRTVTVAPGAVILREGQKVALTELEPGDEVTVRLAGGIAIRITVDKPARQEETVRGEIQGIQPATKNNPARLRLRTEDGRIRTVTLAKDVVIRQGNSRLTLADLREGDAVQVRLVNGVATEVRVLSRGPVVEEVTGTIEQITPATRTAGPKVTVKTGKATRTVTLATDVVIRHGSRRLQVEDLRIGDEVTITVVDGIGTEITVRARGPLVEEVRGTLEKVEPAAKNQPARLIVKTADGSRRIALAADVSIRHGSARLRPEELRPGDELVITLVDGVGTEITVTARGPEIEEVKGTLVAIQLASTRVQARIEVQTDSGIRSIPVAADADIRRGDARIRLSDLQKGDPVTVTVVDGVARAIRAEEIKSEVVSGQLVAVYQVSIDFQPSLLLWTAGGEQRIRLSSETAYVRDGRFVNLDDLQAGDRLQVRLVGGVADRVLVEERPGPAVLSGTLQAIDGRVITIRTSGRQDRKLILAADAVLAMGDRKIGVDELRTGDRVEAKVRGDVVLELTVTRPAPKGR